MPVLTCEPAFLSIRCPIIIVFLAHDCPLRLSGHWIPCNDIHPLNQLMLIHTDVYLLFCKPLIEVIYPLNIAAFAELLIEVCYS